MPRRVDHAAQFAFMREAAFDIVHTRGVGHLSRRALAEQMGVSQGVVLRVLDPACPLERLAADEVVQRRRTDRWFWPRGEGLETAVGLVMRLVPDSPSRAAEELVWLRLIAAAASGATGFDHHVEQREQEVDATLQRVLDLAGIDDAEGRPGALVALRALVDGLTLGVCTDRLEPTAARNVVTGVLTAAAPGHDAARRGDYPRRPTRGSIRG